MLRFWDIYRVMKSSLANKICLITGASGFIGTRLCKELECHGAVVRRLMRRSSELETDSDFCCELGEQNVPDDAIRNVDIIFHLAGRAHILQPNIDEIDLYYKSNVKGTLDILESARDNKVKNFIFFSSVKAMGEGSHNCLDEMSDLNPLTPYGKSKLEAERLVVSGEYVPVATVLRLTMVYGASDKGNLPKMIKAISNNRFPPFPKIINKRSMIHVDDVVQCAMLAAQIRNNSMNTYIINDGIEYSTREIYEQILKLMGKNVPTWSVPIAVLYTAAVFGSILQFATGKSAPIDLDRLHKLIDDSYYSSAKVINELGFQPKYTLYNSLKDIIPTLV